MSLRIILTSLMICWPTLLPAKDITVKSGEHSDFSRLVVYTNLYDKPVLTRTENGFQMTTGSDGDRFAIAGVFDMIPRDRISDLKSSNDGVLNIVLNCSCDAKTQILPNGQFVIDVFNATEPREPFPSGLRQSDPDIPNKDNRTSALEARRGLPIAGTPDASDAGEKFVATIQDDAVDPAPLNPVRTNKLPPNENGLLEQLARAAAQGLVDAPSILDTSVSEHMETTPDPDEPAAEIEGPSPNSASPTATDHIRIQTSVDRDLGRPSAPSDTPETGATCHPPQSFSIANWGKGDGETLDFATYRASLTTEVDRLNPDTFRSFVQHQIFLTLGAEALSYLNSFRGILTNDEDLQLMAEIIETGSATGYARMTPHLACDGPVALWAVLSQPRLPRDHPINTAAVISEFSILPRHLRIHLGPMVMRKFLAIGDTDTSIEINRISQRGIETLSTEHTLADAQLLLETESSSKGRDQLIEIVDRDDHNAVDAILLLIENHIAMRTGIPDRTLELLGSLAHEHKASKRGADLAIAEVRGLIHATRFADARAKLHKFEHFPDQENDSHLQILNEFGMALSKSGSDGTFLRNTIDQPIWADAEEKTRIAIADRLLRLGFASAAKEILINQPFPPGRESRVLIARAAILEGKANVALGYLSGLNDAESQKMRDTFLPATDQMTISTVSTGFRPNNIASEPATEISLEAVGRMIDDSKAIRARVEDALQNERTQ
ncbi:hypothetical protein [Aliiroseovarius sp. F47248L]|uniref:hypothetical protein n=1 Tax=Aliiroseovarius sp. F47248L TaxID=2926420 RepID=UPI001FF555AF|nr:hypothetical protein [Aliiroseovarius sp. F47248L]MCK0139585.1 hypothetical protein [Aliiroseovarius sp. F47248L]